MRRKKSVEERANPEPEPPETPSENRSEKQDVELLKLLRERLSQQERSIQKISTRRFKMFLDSLPLLIVHAGNDQRVTFCNHSFSVFAGAARQGTTGKYLWEAFSSGYDSMRPHLLEAFQGREVSFEQSLSSAVERYFHITITPDLGVNDVVNGVFISLLDITKRKALEEEQRRLARERAELLKSAQDAGKLKDEFIAMLSHELRTPLTSIVGWARLIKSGKLDTEGVAKGIDVIERNTRSQTRLIEELLDISRITSGNVRLERSTVNMGVLVQDLVDALRPTFTEKQLRVELKIADAITSVRADRERLQQVIVNLLSNAIKFTPAGGHVRVEVKRTAAQVELFVQDSGQGIPLEFLPHVFEQFRQADMSTTRKNEGLGLGLSIARKLIEMHNGSIHADSPGPGKGATFTMSLPPAAP